MNNLVTRLIILTGLVATVACGPRAHIPLGPVPVAGSLAPGDSSAELARALAPVLYIQRDEWFSLSRIVAVVHPTRPVIAYHLLWRDDVNGSGIPFTVPTDEEIVWIGYDATTRAPTDIWTYWHGKILHTDWRDRGRRRSMCSGESTDRCPAESSRATCRRPVSSTSSTPSLGSRFQISGSGS